LVVARAEVMASDLRWPLEGFREAFREASDKAMVRADWKVGLVVLRKALIDSTGEPRDTARPESPNVIKHWARSWDEVPDCQLKYEYLRDFESFVTILGPTYLQAFREGFRKALLKASSYPLGNQDQEQKQEQKQEQDIPRDKRAAKAFLPSGWSPERSESLIAAEATARSRGVDVDLELAKLTDWAASNAAKKADWDATWRNWLRSARPTNGQRAFNRSQDALDLQMERIAKLEAEEQHDDSK
jgi:hypothetical protein